MQEFEYFNNSPAVINICTAKTLLMSENQKASVYPMVYKLNIKWFHTLSLGLTVELFASKLKFEQL